MNLKKLRLGFLISFVILTGVAIYIYSNFKNYSSEAGKIERNLQIRYHLDHILDNGFITLHNFKLLRENQRESNDPKLRNQLTDINIHLSKLDSLLQIDVVEERSIPGFRNLVAEIEKLQDSLIVSQNNLDSANQRQLIDLSTNKLVQLRVLISKTNEAELQSFLGRIDERQDSRKRVALTLLFLTFICLLFLGYFFDKAHSSLKSVDQLNNDLESTVYRLKIENYERLKLQQLTRGILDSSKSGIVALDAIRDQQGKIVNLKYIMVNHFAVGLLRKSEQELLDNFMLDTFPGHVPSGLFDAYTQVVETGKEFNTISRYTLDDLNLWLEITAVKNEDGIVITFTDISDFKKNEQELQKRTQLLTESNLELEQFAYIASHDLQEPLRKIRTFGDRLTSKYAAQLDEKGADYIQRMQVASERMQFLIDDLLRYSRVSRTEKVFLDVNLNEVVKDVLEILEPVITQKNAVITYPRLPVIVGDSRQLIQLFQNLLSNSLKYAKPNTIPKIAIEYQEDLDNFYITVSDNGIGFDNKYKEQIFVIFKRLHGRSEYDGTGIGLSICEKIMTNHLGEINAESIQGEGAIFNLKFPKNKLTTQSNGRA